jgi:hypothetical protein
LELYFVVPIFCYIFANENKYIKNMDGVIYGFIGAIIVLGIAYALAIYQSRRD